MSDDDINWDVVKKCFAPREPEEQVRSAREQLASPVTDDRYYGSREIAGLAEAYPELVIDSLPLLIQSLNDPSEDVRRFSVEAMGNLGAAATNAFEKLRHAATKDTEVVRLAAVLALCKIAVTETDRAIASQIAMQAAEHDSDESVREAAIFGLVLATDTDAAQKFLRTRLNVESNETTLCAILSRLEPSADVSYMIGLRRNCLSACPRVQLNAIRALAALGQQGVAARPELRTLVNGDDPYLGVEAARALTAMGHTADIEKLANQLLADPQDNVPWSYEILEIMEIAGTEAPWSLPLLEQTLGKSFDCEVFEAISNIAGGDARFILEKYLNDPNLEIRSSAQSAIRTLPWT